MSEDNISKLHKDPRNARTRDSRAIDFLQQSLRDVGAARSIVIDENDLILAGNGTVTAAEGLGISKLQIIEAEGDTIIAVRRRGLTDEQKTRLSLYDNRTAELAEWDTDVLKELSEEVDLTGFFEPDEWSDLMDSLGEEEIREEDEADVADLIDRAESGEIESRVKLGEIWQLGRHRICCGDSTDEGNVRGLLGDRIGDVGMVWSDPPYGYEYQSNWRKSTNKFEVIENDDKILSSFVKPVAQLTEGWVLVCTSWKVLTDWISACKPLGSLQNLIVWDKGGGGIGDLTHSLSTDYELILAYNRGAKIQGKRIGSVWSIGRDSPDSYKHPTQKPVELPQMAMECFTGKSDLIFDPFLGSAPSIIAAQQMEGDRTVYGFELSPDYCEVICKRFEALTGLNAELVGQIPLDKG